MPKETTAPTPQNIEDKINNLTDLQIRILMSSIFTMQDEVKDESEMDKELIRVRDLWIRDEEIEYPTTEKCVADLKETMKVSQDYFAERGLEKDSLKFNSEFGRYICDYLENNQRECAQIMYDFGNYVCHLSLRPQEQWGICLEAFPPTSEYLKCLGGTKERIEKSQQDLTALEQHKPFLRAHDIVISNAVASLKDHISPEYETHLTSYLEYSLGLRKEKMILPQSQVPAANACRIHSEYAPKFKGALVKEIADEVQDRKDEIAEVLNSVQLLFPSFNPDNFKYDKELKEVLKSGLKPYEIEGEDFEEYDEEQGSLSLNRDLLNRAGSKTPASEFLENFVAREDVTALAFEPIKNQESVTSLRRSDSKIFFTGEGPKHILKLLTDESEPVNHQEKLIGLEALWMMGDHLAGNSPNQFLRIMSGLNAISEDYLEQKITPQIEQFLPNQVAKIELIGKCYERHSVDQNITPLGELDNIPLGNLFIGNAPLEVITQRINGFSDAASLVDEIEKSLEDLSPQPQSYSLACNQLVLRPDAPEIFENLFRKINSAIESDRAILPVKFIKECLEAAAQNNNSKACKLLLENFSQTTEVFEGSSVMHSAAMHNNADLARFVISRVGFDEQHLLSQVNEDGYTPPITAAMYGNVEFMRAMYEDAGEEVSEVNEIYDEGNGLLHVAALAGHSNFVKFLGEVGSNLGIAGSEGSTAAHNAVQGGHVNVIEALKESGLSADDLNLENDERCTPMEWAILADSKSLVLALGEAGVRDQYINRQDSEGDAPIHLAAIEDRADLIATLSDLGADLNKKNNYEDAAIHRAVNSGFVDVVEALAKAGADLTLTNKDGKTPLDLAIEGKMVDIVTVLGNYAVDLQSHLMKAVNQANRDVIKVLGDAGVDLNQEDENGRSLIYNVVRKVSEEDHRYGKMPDENMKRATALIKAGANVNHINRNGDSLLHTAVHNMNLSAFNMLASLGADFNQEDKNGHTPIYLAAYLGAITILHHIDLNRPINNKGHTLLTQAIIKKDNIVVRNLLTAGASSAGNYLSYAAYYGTTEIVETLLSKRVDINRIDEKGATALHYAAKTDNLPMMKYLRERGAVDRKDADGKLPSDFLSQRKKAKEEMENFSKNMERKILPSPKIVPPSSASKVVAEIFTNVVVAPKKEPSHNPIPSYIQPVNDNDPSHTK